MKVVKIMLGPYTREPLPIWGQKDPKGDWEEIMARVKGNIQWWNQQLLELGVDQRHTPRRSRCQTKLSENGANLVGELVEQLLDHADVRLAQGLEVFPPKHVVPNLQDHIRLAGSKIIRQGVLLHSLTLSSD